jgi:fructose-bisphosphate aldolase class II
MLVSMKSILDKAKEGGYAVAAPNVCDQHTVLACLQAAEELKSPIILDFGEKAGEIFTFGKIAVPLCRDCSVPVAINLDHGGNFEIAMKAIRAGFTSVMVDRSALPYAENVKEVKEITRIAHISGVSVESELGRLIERNKDSKDETLFLTDPQEAKSFVEETGIDCLAVAIGTAHGMYKGTPFLDFDRLAKIRQTVNVPLVLHGGSFTGDENLQKTVRAGICKVNLATDILTSSAKSLKTYMDGDPKPTLVKAYAAVIAGYKEALLRYMRLFNCVNKAQ